MNEVFFLSPESVAFTTREFARVAGTSVSAATHRLSTAGRREAIVRLTRGVWANRRHPFFSPLGCVATLLAAEQGYVSFLTALHLHGLLSQIPATIHVATTGRSRTVSTPVGDFAFFQVKPELMRVGIEWSSTRVPYRIASVEKALFDTLYLATRKGCRFRVLPELDFSAGRFNRRRFTQLLSAAELSPPLTGAIAQRFRELLGGSA